MKAVSYSVFFKPVGHESIHTYHELDVDQAINRALGIYHNMPFPHEVKVIDSDDNLILLLVKYFKNL